MRKRLLTALLVIALAALLGASAARRGYEAVLVLAELVGRPAPARLDPRPLPTRRTITYERGGRRYDADLYEPAGVSPRAGLVFVPGAVERGKDDPRVVEFASTLARSKFAVLVPDVVALRELRLLPDSAVDVADALAWLRGRPDLAPGGRLGVLTTSVAIGPAMLALLAPAAGDVRFFLSIGGYYDLPRTLAYLTTGRYDAHGVARRDAPNDYGKWIFALSNAARLPDAAERAAFERLARRKLADPNADVSADLAELGQGGRAVHAYIVNTDPARSRELLEALPQNLRADVDRLNLAARDLHGLRAKFILVHGMDDDTIPYGESVGLAAALPNDRTRLFVLSGFQHVEVSPRGLVDGLGMWRAIDALLAER